MEIAVLLMLGKRVVVGGDIPNIRTGNAAVRHLAGCRRSPVVRVLMGKAELSVLSKCTILPMHAGGDGVLVLFVKSASVRKSTLEISHTTVAAGSSGTVYRQIFFQYASTGV